MGRPSFCFLELTPSKLGGNKSPFLGNFAGVGRRVPTSLQITQ